MAVGSYFTTGAPSDALGYMVQAESRVRLGLYELYGSLETTSWTYTTYGTSIGLKAGTAIDLGQVESLSFTHQPSFEALESANVQQATVYVLTGEETTVGIGLRQFDPRVLQVALGTAQDLIVLGNDYLMPFGGACTATRRPLEIAVTNIGCNKPTSPDAAASGITAIVLTLYSVQATSGLDWGDIVANAVNTIDLEFSAVPVNANALGNRLGNLYIF